MNNTHFLVIESIPPRKLIYKTIGDKNYNLHLFQPDSHKASDKRGCILFFFGGGWNKGTPSQFYPHCQYFASRGMMAVSAEYRIKLRDDTSPFDSVSDGKSAMRWLRQHAEELGIDSRRIAAAGGSAGAHIAAATATLASFDDSTDDLLISCKPNTLVLFNPILNTGPEGFGYNRVKDRWKDFSPLHNVTNDAPPTIIFSGSDDKLVAVADIEKYKTLMNDFGLRCDAHIYEGQSHGFFNYQDGRNPYFYTTLFEADQFLSSFDYLQGSPLVEKSLVKATLL